MSEACCAAGKLVESCYNPKGKTSFIGDLPIYEVGTGKTAVIVAYDIFGFEVPNTRHVCDILAESGFRVVLPDYFRGNPWPEDDFPPKDFQELGQWALKMVDDHVLSDNALVLEYLKNSGSNSFAMVGFCWGGKAAIQAGATGEFQAAATAHPSLLNIDDAQKLKCPMLFCPTKNDRPPIGPVKGALDKLDIGAKCQYHPYDDQTHGFVTARGNWSDPDTKAAVDDFLKRTVDFFSIYLQPLSRV